MSDIDIRLDGLLLGLVMFAGIVLFAAMAIAAACRAYFKSPQSERARKVAVRSAAMAIGQAGGFALLAAYRDKYDATIAGPDWIDWLSVPWSVFILVGLVLMLRKRPAG